MARMRNGWRANMTPTNRTAQRGQAALATPTMGNYLRNGGTAFGNGTVRLVTRNRNGNVNTTVTGGTSRGGGTAKS